MERKQDGLWRYIVIGAVFVLVSLVYIGIFVNLQVTGQDYYTMSSPVKYSTRSVKIQAQRGEIYDRNGNKLVGNKFYNDIRLDYSTMPRANAGKNGVILSLLDYLEQTGESDKLLPYKYTPFDITMTDGALSFSYNAEFFETARSAKYEKLAAELNIKEDADAEAAAEVFMYRYGLTDKDGLLTVGAEDAAVLLYYRMDFEMCDFSDVSPYSFASDVSIEFIAKVREASLRGFTVYCRYSRTYNYPGYATHILGRIQKIPASDVEK